MDSLLERMRQVIPSFQLEGRNGRVLGLEKDGALRMMLPSVFKDATRPEYVHIISCALNSADDVLWFRILFETMPFEKWQLSDLKHFLEWLRPIHRQYQRGELNFCVSPGDIVLSSSVEFKGASQLQEKREIDKILRYLIREGDSLFPFIKSAREGMYIGEEIVRFAYGPFCDEIKH